MLRRVGDLPFGRLDVDRDAREEAVLAGMIDMEVAVDDGRDVLESRCRPRPGRPATRRAVDPVVGVELVVAEAETGVEQEHAAAMADRIGDHDPGLAGMRLIGSEPELAKDQRNDVERVTTATARQLRRDGGRWQGGGEHRSERTSGCVSEERRRQRGQGPSDRRSDVAERAGFEPATGCPEPHFQCGAIVH